MKKLFFLSVVCFGLATTGRAQTENALKSEIRADKKMGEGGKADKQTARKELRKLEGNEVNYNSVQAFDATFPNIKPTSSERLDNFDQFDFIKKGQKMSAFFDENSKLVGTVEVKTYADLPAKAKEYISKKYKGYIPSNVLFLDNNELNNTPMVLFNIQFDPEDSYFVELSNGYKAIVLQVEKDGFVNYFTRIF